MNTPSAILEAYMRVHGMRWFNHQYNRDLIGVRMYKIPISGVFRAASKCFWSKTLRGAVVKCAGRMGITKPPVTIPEIAAFRLIHDV